MMSVQMEEIDNSEECVSSGDDYDFCYEYE